MINDLTFSNLDPSQRQALNQIVLSDSSTHIVYGPPGTGKSQLVVSLLEHLASHGKTVLFVSQNTEALRVIERMIKKTEKSIDYPSGNENLSLLDFCLLLYEPSQRRLKYLREHYAIVNIKHLPEIIERGQISEVKYPLSYTKLDHNANWNTKGDEIGFDELMSYYLKYVNCKLAPEVLREFEKIDVRRVFQLLDDYKYRDDFAYFNNPRKELSLLSTENPDLNLPTMRIKIKDLKQATLPIVIDGFIAKDDIKVQDYMDGLLAYARVVKDIDVYRMATEEVGATELIEFLDEFEDKSSSFKLDLERIESSLEKANQQATFVVDGVDCDTQVPELSKKIITMANDDFGQTLEDCQKISQLIVDVSQFCRGVKFIGINELCALLAKTVMLDHAEALNAATENEISKELWGLKVTEIEELNADLQDYVNKTGLAKLIKTVPQSFVSYLGLKNKEWLKFYQENFYPVYEDLMPILKETNLKVADIIKLAETKTSTTLEKLGLRIKDRSKLQQDFIIVAKLQQLLMQYGFSATDYDEMLTSVSKNIASLELIQKLTENEHNEKFVFQRGLAAFIRAIANTADVIKLKHQLAELQQTNERSLKELFETKSAYFDDVNTVNDLLSKTTELKEKLLQNRLRLAKSFTTIELPVTDVDLDIVKLENAKKVLDELEESNYFSEYFYQLHTKQNLKSWLDEISILETYNNDAEMADFVEHNHMINQLHQAMGAANRQYLDSILTTEDLTFDKLANRLVNVLVQSVYGYAPLEARKHIYSNDFFDEYAEYLKSQKSKYYRDGLQQIYEQSADALRELARQEALKAGNSIFDKFRNKTDKIIQAFPIVCATPKEVAKYLAPIKGIFDYAIFDEASQLLPGQAIPSIFRAKQAVVLGDPHQMPPSLNATFGNISDGDDEDVEEDLGESILDLMRRQPGDQHHLKVHYRSRYNKLFEPSRQAIYSSEGIEPIFEAELSTGAPIDIEDNLGENKDEAGYDQNFHSICQSAMKYLTNIKDLNEINDAIFCILFARGEVLSSFKRFLAEGYVEQKYKLLVNLFNQEKVLLSTVTNCQGIEGLYTIIYLQYYKTPASMWFFKEGAGAYKRLNVAITRQREGLKLLLANPRSAWINACESRLNNPHSGPNTVKGASLMKQLLENAGEVTGVTYLDRILKQNAENFDSPLTEQLYHKLIEHYKDVPGNDVRIYSEVGWNLIIPTGEGIAANERNVGFRIDLGVYSVRQQKFVLGIEMDGATYHSGFHKEQSDYNRQFVLEKMKGWKLYRIWSTNWLNDEEAEFNELVQKIDELLQ